MNLPEALNMALDDACSAYTTKAMSAAAQRLSDRYRGVSGAHSIGASPTTLDALTAVAYAATRLPATYAATVAALGQARWRVPSWRPRTLLDVGAGTGATLWAAHSVWPDLEQAELLERAPHMIALGKQFCAAASASVVREAHWQEADVTGEWNDDQRVLPPTYDLVTAGYLLGELAMPQRERLIERLWESTTGALALIAPGTPVGFAHIHAARTQLLAAGATILAPCPHESACPMRPFLSLDEEPIAAEASIPALGQMGNWCHFSQRLARSRRHRQLKGGELSYEDEKFAYVIVARPDSSAMQVAPIGGRIVRHPQIRPGVVTLEVCERAGRLEQRAITRRDREAFRQARDLHWGDALK